MKWLAVFTVAALLSCSPMAWAADANTVDQNFARSLVKDNLDHGDYQFLATRLQGLDRNSLAELRQWLKENQKTLVEPEYSIFAHWSFYQIIYYIDDQLGELKYDFVLEGTLGDLLETLFGCGYYTFRLPGEPAAIVFITPATLYPDGYDADSPGKSRVFIRQLPATQNAPLRNEVVKFEKVPEGRELNKK